MTRDVRRKKQKRRMCINKKHAVLSVLALAAVVILAVFVRDKLLLIHKPADGDDRADYYENKEISDENKLLISGASAGINTNPDQKGLEPYLRLDGVRLDNYYRQNEVFFAEEDFETKGVLTYRGNSLRSGSVYGNAGIKEGVLSEAWKVKTGKSVALSKNIDYVGQPLIITWSETEKKLLNLKKSVDDSGELTEVICAGVDGKVYFLDISDGSSTREPINLGCPVTGTGTICPDKTPMYVVGAGDCSQGDTSEIYVMDLISSAVIHSFGDRRNFAMELPEEKYDFSASAIISDAIDCLITQGENGVIYSYSLSASASSGELGASFSQSAEYTYKIGVGEDKKELPEFASSPAAWGSYLYTVDKNGYLLCTDVNDWNTVWVRNLGASCDATPCLEIDKNTGNAYIYIGSSLKLSDGKKTAGEVYIYKLNAANGDIIWRREYEAQVTKKTDGGVVASACLGTGRLDEYVYFTVAGCDSKKSGLVVCLDKEDGGERYSVELKNYSVSDPVAVYGENGKGYVVICDNEGNIFMLEGESGECLSVLKLRERLTSSPAVYDGILTVATEEGIYGIKLK